jgi:hypothetical protein
MGSWKELLQLAAQAQPAPIAAAIPSVYYLGGFFACHIYPA